MIEALAPGKLVVCGEYAVLCGAPAIAMAVDVRARARVTLAKDRSLLNVSGAGEMVVHLGASRRAAVERTCTG